jgi:hypothetical protein
MRPRLAAPATFLHLMQPEHTSRDSDVARTPRLKRNQDTRTANDREPARHQSRASGASHTSASTGHRMRRQLCCERSPDDGSRLRPPDLAFAPIPSVRTLRSPRSLSTLRHFALRDRVGDDARVRSRSPVAGADLRFAWSVGALGTFEINGKRSSGELAQPRHRGPGPVAAYSNLAGCRARLTGCRIAAMRRQLP